MAGSISGQVFLDADADKALDNGEDGLAGVTVTLKTAVGATVASTTTDAQGNYTFNSVADGSYKVLFAAAGYLADNGEPKQVTLAGQAGVSGVNVGFFKPAYISGVVSLASSGARLEGVTIQLLDTAGHVVATTTSGVALDGNNDFTIHGFYAFYNVVPGTYTVQALIPNAVIPPLPSAGIVLVSGQSTTSNIAIQSNAVSGIDSISGIAFVDSNGNGQQDNGETALANIAVTIKSAAGVPIATAVTDLAGHYDVKSLTDGLYTVSFAPGAGRASDSVPVRLSASNPNQSADGLFYAPATISGVVFNDANSDGVSGAGDARIGGVTVRLLDASGTTIATTTTDGNGFYGFTGVKPGGHLIQFTTPNGDVATTPTLVDLQVSNGQNVTANAGFHVATGTVSLSGTAFLDANGNHVQDNGEVGLDHVNVVVVSNAGTAVQTAVTDAAGHYSFSNIANGTYSVTFATPAGDVATTPTTIRAGTIASGGTKTGLDAGFAPDATPAAGSVPASTTLNIILRGQSNSQYFVQFGMLDKLKADIETMLGFDGVHQKVNLLASFFQGDSVNTINSGTALVGQWLTPINGDYHNGWQATSLELGLQTAIARQPNDFKSNPTAVIWLHNETDTNNNPNITSDQWQSAARYEAGLVRGLLGQDAGSVPYLFVNAIPFPSNGIINGTNPPPPPSQADQAIRAGMAALAADPSFGGHIVAQSGDVNMDANHLGAFGGAHNDLNDFQQLEYRLARSLADTFSASAQPGSPLVLAGGHVDNLGPQVIAAATVAGHDDQLLLTVQHDAAISLEALGIGAAQALGWSLRGNATGSGSALQASGVAARLIDATHLLVTFDTNVQATSKLFYAWGSPRIAPDAQPGTGNAVYDNNHLPIWAVANGVGISNIHVALSSTISGVAFFDTNGTHFADNDESGLAGLAVTLKDSGGATVATATTDQYGAYSFTITTPGTYGVAVTSLDPALLSGGTASQTVIVGSGQNLSNINAGFYAPALIVGVTSDDTATYLNGITVELLNAAGVVVGTTLTSNTNPLSPGQDGLYSFEDLTPGYYSVRFTPPVGKVLTTPAVSSVGALTSGQQVEVSGVFITAVASIAGTVFADANADNALNGNDAGFAGVSVTLKSAGGATVATTTTDALGHYNFGNLPAGTYTINTVAPSGWFADSTTPPSVVVADHAVTAPDLGFYVPVFVHGQLYNDLNRDGTHGSSEPAMTGVKLNLVDQNGTIVDSMTTWANDHDFGIYAFDNIRPGNYRLQAVIPGEPLAQPFTPLGQLNGGQGYYGFYAAGVTTPLSAGSGSIAGTAFIDDNADFALSNGEGGLAGVTVTLKTAAGATASRVTDSQGHYNFNGIADGAYTVSFVPPNGGLTSSLSGAGSVTVSGGQAVTNVDAGYYAPISIHGQIFNDVDRDGTKDANEAFMVGIKVNLLDMNGTVVATTASMANNDYPGIYQFDNIKPGTYQIQAVIPGEPLPQPFTQTGVIHSGQGLQGFNASAVMTPLATGNGTIAGTAFLDSDADKALDSGESGLAGVTVTLKTAGGRTITSTTTDAQGHYGFGNLPDDSYKVLFSAAGYLADNGEPQPVTLAGLAAISGVNAGFFKPAYISGNVNLASNGASMDGMTIQLLDAAGHVVATTATGLNDYHSFYSFYNVMPGTYTVQAVIPNAAIPPQPSASFVLISGQISTQHNIAIQSTALLPGIDSIYGTAFVDSNGNGQQDGGEAALANIAVTVKNAVGAPVSTATTNADGHYYVEGLTDGLYAVSFASSAGQVSDSAPVRLTVGNPLQVADGAFYAPATVSGMVFNDDNSNGLAESGDNGIGGVIVRLLDAGGVTVATAVTGGNGAYSFTSVKPGGHAIQFATPNGDVATTPALIDLHQVAGGQSVTANAGVHAVTGTVSLSGTAFLDSNANGVQDNGEVGLDHVNAVLVTSAGRAVQTAVTDVAGHYSFSNVANGTYAVTFATPAGDLATTPTTVQAGTIASGGTKTGLDVGFAPDATPAAGPFPASTTLNIILRGQSNSQFFTQVGMLDKLKADVEAMLGFDGVHQKVNLLATMFQPDGANTINGGTAVIGNWLQPINGDYHNGWQATSLELGLQTAIARQPADFKAAPTAVIWLHNESDSQNGNLTTDQWQSAARFEAGLVRGLLGQDAGSVPYLFVNAIPFPSPGNSANQAIRIGMAALSADTNFNAHIVAQSADVNMDADTFGGFGGNHNDPNDALQLEYRLARSLANTFSASAQPGSPLVQAGGHVDNLGPKVIAAATVAGHDDQLLLTIQHDAAINLEALGVGAAQALGWSLRGSAVGSASAVEASGIAARLIDATHLLVTFDTNVQSTSKLFYAWGGPRIAPVGQPGTGNAVYDSNHLPIWTDANGVGITNTHIALSSTISGVAFLDTNGDHSADHDESGLAGLAVTLKDSGGATVATATTDQHGAYSFMITTPGSYGVAVTPLEPALLSGGTASQTVIVGSGQNLSNVNAGFYAPAIIVGVTMDDSSTYLNGITVELLNAAGVVVGTTLSSNTNPLSPGQDGIYSFDDLTPGSYSVRFTPPAGKVLITPAVTTVGALTSGQQVQVSGTFATTVGAIAGTVFADDNGNNLHDSGEAGIAGVDVVLKTAAGATVATMTTDALGHYSFGNLAADTYTVNAATPSGKTPDSTTPPSVVVTDHAVAQDVGFYTTASVHGQVYNDIDRDGTKDASEAFMAGVTLNLIDQNGTIVDTTTSQARSDYPGFYAFDTIRPGTYHIQAVIPGEPLAQPSTSLGAVRGGQLFEGFNAAAVTTPVGAGNGSVAGTVFLDANGNNILDAGDDTGFAGYVVTLKDANGATVASATSDAQGHYSFGGLADGNYTIAFDDSSQNLIANAGTGTRSVTIAQGHAVSNVDAGFSQGGAVYGFGFFDADHNGALDDGEAVNGEIVELIDSQGHVVATTMTGPNNPFLPVDGVYFFLGLAEGSYSVRFTPPAGLALVTPGAVAVTVTKGQVVEIDSPLDLSSADTTKPVIAVQAPAAQIAATNAAGAAVLFSGTATDNLDGTDPVVFKEGNAVVTSGKVFSIGSHTISASATDAAGNVADPVNFSFTVADMTKPIVAVQAPAVRIGATSAAGAAVTFSATASDNVDGTDPVVFKEGNAVVTSGKVFSIGSHTISASSADAAGNVADPVNFSFTVADMTKPLVALQAPAARIAATHAAGAVVTFSATASDNVDGADAVIFKEGTNVVASGAVFGLGSHTVMASATDAAGNAADPVSFSFTVSDGVKPVIGLAIPAAHVEATSKTGAAVTFAGVAIDAIDGVDPVVFKEGTRVVTSGAEFGLGVHTLTASAADAAGNAADPQSFSFTVSDTTKPLINLLMPAAHVEAISSAGAAVSFSGFAHDAVDGFDPVVFQEGTAVVTSGQVFSIGSHTLTAAATDAAGNAADRLNFSFAVSDTAKPSIGLTAPAVRVEATSSAGAAVTFAGTASDSIDGTDPVVFKEGTAVVTSGKTFGLGVHTIAASATDAGGNAADPKTFSFTVSDTTKPTISLTAPAPHVEATSATGAAVSFSGFAHDSVDGTDPVVFKEGATVVTSGKTFGLGVHTIAASATDASGNSADLQAFSFTVSDTTKPSISLTAPAAHIVATSSAGAAISFSGLAHDAVDGTDPVVFKEGTTIVSSGQTFGIGAHSIVGSATDAAGNSADTLNFSFTVDAFVPTAVNNGGGATPPAPVPTPLPMPAPAVPVDHFYSVGDMKALAVASYNDPSEHIFQHDLSNTAHAWLM